MPVKKIQALCPNCRQPIIVETEQLYDVGQDPSAKERLLSGRANLINCPNCRYQGPYSLPLIYHDPANELLLTYVPSELGLPLDAQERVIGPLINQAVNSLPQERRKAYLLQPKSMLTMQTLFESILEKDGITKEMLQSQQVRLQLLQRLINITMDDVMAEIVRQEDALIDEEFFPILSNLMANASRSGNEGLVRKLGGVQEQLLKLSTYGRQLSNQAEEMDAAVASLQAFGQKLRREDLVDLVVKAPTETRLQALVGVARTGMDYEFFQQLTERIERARGDGRKRVLTLRESLLALTAEYDRRAAKQVEQIKQLLETLIDQPDSREVLTQNPEIVSDLFLQILQSELGAARQAVDPGRAGKLQRILDVIRELSAPPPEVALINELVGEIDPAKRDERLAAVAPEVLAAMLETLTGLMAQLESAQDPQLTEQVKSVYRQALRFSMQKNLQV